jgi:Dolichyl-phosphate-mannose-protein mannosyltransferase
MTELVRLLLEPSPLRLEAYAVGYQIAWIVALALALLAVVSVRRHIGNHRRALLALTVLAVVVRIVSCDFHASDEQWPYITQATCIAFAEARSAYNLCSVDLFGDVHQLGTASLFALGFRLFGGYKAVAGLLVFAASVINVLLVYAVAQRAFGDRKASFLAGLVMAVHPAAVFFSGATQTEVFNDTFLALGALLVLWDVDRAAAPAPSPPNWAARLASNPLSRAFFVAMAVNVRPELIALLPLLIGSSFFAACSRRDALFSAGALAFAALPLLVPVLPGAFLKASQPTPFATQVIYAGQHLLDVYRLMLGPVGLVLLAIGFVLTLRSRKTGSQCSVFAWLALGVTAVYVVVQGLFEHVMRGQPHVLYHGSILWWPIVGLVVARGAELAAHRKGWPWPGNVTRWLNVGAVLLFLGLLLPSNSFGYRPAFLNPQILRHASLVEAIPAGSHVIPVTRGLFVDGGVASALFSHGGYTVHAPNIRSGFDPDLVCRDACPSLVEPLKRGRPVRLVERCEEDPSRRRYPKVLETCGIETGNVSIVGGFCVVEVTSTCRAPVEPAPERSRPKTARGVSSACPYNISPETAQRVFEATKATSPLDGCTLKTVETKAWYTEVQLAGHDGEHLSARIVPVGCQREGLSGDEFTLLPAGPLRVSCPKTHAVLVDLVGESKIGKAVEPSSLTAPVAPPLPLLPRLAIGAAAALLAFAALTAVRRRRSSQNSAKCTRQLPVSNVYLAVCLGGVAAFISYVVPSVAAKACLQPMDFAWLVNGLTHPLRGFGSVRPLAVTEARLLFELVGVHPGHWVWALAGLHLVNAGLLVWLSKAVGLVRPYPWIAGMLFFASPALTGALGVEYLLEAATVSAWLLLCGSYLARAHAASRRDWTTWLVVELSAVVLGVGNKESFVIYPLVLLGLELAVRPGGNQTDLRSRLVSSLRRLAPHAIMFPVAALIAVPQVLSSGHKTPVSLSPGVVVQKLSDLVGASAGAGVAVWIPVSIAGAAIVGLAIGMSVTRPRQASAVRAGTLLMLTMSLPMLVLPDRLFPGYLLHVWPGAVIAAVALLQQSRSAIPRLLLASWMLTVLFASPVVTLPQPCLVTDAVLDELNSVDARCGAKPPTWNASPELFEAAELEFRAIDPARPSSEVTEIVTTTFADFFRLWCKNPDAEMHVPDAKP